MGDLAKETGEYQVVWPCGDRRQAVAPLAKRLDTLNGKTVAQLWDYLFAGTKCLPNSRTVCGVHTRTSVS